MVSSFSFHWLILHFSLSVYPSLLLLDSFSTFSLSLLREQTKPTDPRPNFLLAAKDVEKEKKKKTKKAAESGSLVVVAASHR